MLVAVVASMQMGTTILIDRQPLTRITTGKSVNRLLPTLDIHLRRGQYKHMVRALLVLVETSACIAGFSG